MLNTEQILEIIRLYTKHDWNLRRILLTSELRKELGDSLSSACDGSTIIDSEIDAVWFSRQSGKDNEAWELRRLDESPYALFEIFDADDEEQVREEIRSEMEQKLRENFYS